MPDTFQGNIFYSVINAGDTTPTKLYVFNPDNGQNTEVLGLPAGRFYGIKQMNGLLYISHSDGGVWRYDGVNLAQLTATPFNATNFVSTMVEFGGEMYFGTSSGNVYQSTDGSTFTLKMTVSTSASTKTITDFAVWNGYLYGADVEGYSYSSKIFRTNDGKTWTVVLNSPSFELDGFVAAPDRLYIASVENASWGSFRVRGSTDGTTWTDVIPTTAQGKQLYGRPCYFSQTGTVYYATNFYGDALWPIQNGVAGLAIRPAHGFNSLIEVDGRLFGIGSQSNSNASTSPYVISVLGNYQKTTGIQVTPSSINEGESVTMAGSFIDPGVLDTHTVLIDWGDGSTPTTLNLARGVLTFTTPAHQYFDNLPGNAPYTINVTVTDKDGGVGTESAAVTVTNLAPMAIINGAPATSPTGTPISLTSTVTDPGPTDQTAGFTYSWDVTKVHGATTTLHFATGASANFSFTPYDDGTYTVTLIATDKDGQTSNITRQVVTVPDTTPPSVTNVLVSGTAWTTGFLDYLTSLYSQDLNGYSIPVGSGVQLVTLPWVNIDQIKVVFSEGVVVDQSDLKLSGVNLTDYAFKPDLPNGLPNDGFVYDPATLTATWTLTGPINSDKLMIRLDATSSNAIKDIAGNVTASGQTRSPQRRQVQALIHQATEWPAATFYSGSTFCQEMLLRMVWSSATTWLRFVMHWVLLQVIRSIRFS